MTALRAGLKSAGVELEPTEDGAPTASALRISVRAALNRSTGGMEIHRSGHNGLPFQPGALPRFAQQIESLRAPSDICLYGERAHLSRFKDANPAGPGEYVGEGMVVVDITVDAEGRPLRGQVRTGPPELMLTALAYALDWTFEPARLNGVASKCRFQLTMPFKLR